MPSLRLFDRIVIGTHISYTHQTIIIKFPVLITVSTHPLNWVRGISPFVFELHVFQAFSATLTFNLAFSSSNGGLISVGLLLKHLFETDVRYIILLLLYQFRRQFLYFE